MKLIAAAIAVLALAAARSEAAEPRRFALLVGAASGEAGEERLRFAEADALRIAAILRDVGGFAPEDVVVLDTVNASEVRRALIAINARVRETTGDSLLFVFYSGHADAEALQLAGTRLPVSELRDLVYGSPATARVLVIDACRSGSATRIKGGTRGPAFAIDVDERLRSKGVAILTSSAEGEDSQESDDLRASFFTHYLASGLRGAADADSDSRVTLVEAFTYASERTLAATSRTFAGPQHPTYRFDLTGREDLVLTRPIARGQRIGTLVFAEPGAYFVQQRDGGRAPLAEVEVTAGARSLALPADDYLVTRRARDHLLQGRFAVVASRETAVRGTGMERIEYARVVRKGGTTLRRTASAFAGGAVRSAFAGVGIGAGAEGGVRLDMESWSAELRVSSLWYGSADPGNAKPVQSAHELGAVVAGLRALDLRRVTLAAGVEIGGVRMTRVNGIDSGLAMPPLEHGIVVGGLGQAQLQIAGPLYLRLELGALGYIFDPRPGSPYEATVVWSGNLGAGLFF